MDALWKGIGPDKSACGELHRGVFALGGDGSWGFERDCVARVGVLLDGMGGAGDKSPAYRTNPRPAG